MRSVSQFKNEPRLKPVVPLSKLSPFYDDPEKKLLAIGIGTSSLLKNHLFILESLRMSEQGIETIRGSPFVLNLSKHTY